MTAEVREIVAGLTKAQREALATVDGANFLPNFVLIMEGLLTWRKRWWAFGERGLYRTWKGRIAARKILKEQDNGQ